MALSEGLIPSRCNIGGMAFARRICARNRRGFLAVSQCLLYLCIPLELNLTPGTRARINANDIIA